MVGLSSPRGQPFFQCFAENNAPVFRACWHASSLRAPQGKIRGAERGEPPPNRVGKTSSPRSCRPRLPLRTASHGRSGSFNPFNPVNSHLYISTPNADATTNILSRPSPGSGSPERSPEHTTRDTKSRITVKLPTLTTACAQLRLPSPTAAAGEPPDGSPTKALDV